MSHIVNGTYYIGTKALAGVLAVSESAVRQWIAKNELPEATTKTSNSRKHRCFSEAYVANAVRLKRPDITRDQTVAWATVYEVQSGFRDETLRLLGL